MITVDQFRALIDYITTWWPSSKIWDDPGHAGKLFKEFERFELSDVQVALQQLRSDGGQHAPSPAKVIDRVEKVTLARHGKLPGDDSVNWVQVCRETGHHWSVLDEVTGDDVANSASLQELARRADELVDAPVGSRLAQCSRCLMKSVFARGKLLTSSELAERPELDESSIAR